MTEPKTRVRDLFRRELPHTTFFERHDLTGADLTDRARLEVLVWSCVCAARRRARAANLGRLGTPRVSITTDPNIGVTLEAAVDVFTNDEEHILYRCTYEHCGATLSTDYHSAVSHIVNHHGKASAV